MYRVSISEEKGFHSEKCRVLRQVIYQEGIRTSPNYLKKNENITN